MSQSNLQLLLHAGELEYIYKTIRESLNRNNRFVGGCLFGLWRNSLKQPVIQFVTGPGKDFGYQTSLREMFNSTYVKSCAKLVEDQHCLLHLGFWFYGPQHQEEDIKEIVFAKPKTGQPKNVLLFINDKQTMWGEYILRIDGEEEKSPLFKEDVLPHHSSFRKFESLTDAINNKGDVISPKYDDRRGKENVLKEVIDNLPSRLQVEEAVTSERQWYSSEEGMVNLQLLFQHFQEANITPSMSRDTVTQDMQFGLSDGYCLEFPANFPRKMPTLRAPDGSVREMDRGSIRNEDVCRMVVQTVVEFLSRNSSRRQRGDRYY